MGNEGLGKCPGTRLKAGDGRWNGLFGMYGLIPHELYLDDPFRPTELREGVGTAGEVVCGIKQ